MTEYYPSQIHPKLARLLEGLSMDDLIHLLSWLYENQFHLTSVQINRWRQINKLPQIEIK